MINLRGTPPHPWVRGVVPLQNKMKGKMMIDFNQDVFKDAHEDEVRAILKEETPGYLKGLRAIGEGCYLRRGAMFSDDVDTCSQLTGEQFVAIIGKDK